MIESALYLIGGFLLAAIFSGITLLKAYDEFRKGIEKKSRFHLWSAFFIVSFLFMSVTFAILRSAR